MQGHHDARFGEFGGPAPRPEWTEGPTRVSILAISSLVTGVIALLGCCVPALGVLPVGLGAGAIVAIQRARGQLAGRGMAIGGLVMGLLSLVVSTGLWIGGATIGNRIGPVYSQAFSPDPSVVRSVLSSSAAAEVTDEQIAAFQQSLAADYGGSVAIPKGFLALYAAYSRVDPDVLSLQPDNNRGNPYLMPADSDRGWLVVVPVMSPRESANLLPYLEDVGYVSPDGGVVWLLSPRGENQRPSPGPADDGADTPAPDPGG